VPRRRQVVASAALLSAAVLLGPAAARGAAPDTVASRVPVTISAASLDVGRLTYVDTVAVSTASGPVSALELGIDQAAFHGLAMTLPCVPIQLGGLTGKSTTDGTSTAAQVTVYATDVAATIGGTRVRFSSTDATYPPPSAGTVLVTDGTLVDPAMVTVLAIAPGLEVHGLTSSATFCHPGAGAALSGLPLTAVPAPSTSSETAPESTAPTATETATTPDSPSTGQPADQPSSVPSGNPTTEPAPVPSETQAPTADPSGTPGAVPSGTP
jgi:hypothetical protein